MFTAERRLRYSVPQTQLESPCRVGSSAGGSANYAELHAFGRLAPALRVPTKKERAECDALDKERALLEREYEDESAGAGADDAHQREHDRALFARS
jgi:hypothetical protein